MTYPGLMEIAPARPITELDADSARSPHYLLALDTKGQIATYVHKQTRLGRVLVKVTDQDKIKPRNLPTYDTSGFIWKDIPPLPSTIIDQAWSFFADVYAKHTSEAIVLLTLDEDDQWHLHAPEQEVSHAGLDYTALKDLPPDQAIMGSIHSHADFDAFHSGTDETDSAKNDGLHITIGHVNTDSPSFDAMIAFNGLRWDKLVTVEGLTGTRTVTRAAYPAEWMDHVSEAKSLPLAKTLMSQFGYGPGYQGVWRRSEASEYGRYTPAHRQTGHEDWDEENWESYVEYLESNDFEIPGWLKAMPFYKKKHATTKALTADDEPRWMGLYYDRSDKRVAYDQLAFDLHKLREHALTLGINLRYRLKFNSSQPKT